MLEDTLSVGNKIEMHEIDTSFIEVEESKKPVYVSQILEFDDDDDEVINIAMPIFEGRLIPLEIGKQYELFFYTPKGIFTCKSIIENRYKSNNIYILIVRLTSTLKKHQRRQYFRLETNMELQYKRFDEEAERYFRLMGKISDEMEERKFDAGVTLDISGGGARFVSKEQLPPGEKMLVRISFSIDGVTRVCDPVARVIASIPARGRNNVFESRIEFVQIKDAEREALIKYIFKTERDMRRRKMD